jgi:cytoskeletal protein CcmA (bactofilin family)
MFGRNKRKNGIVHTLVGSGSRIEGDLRFDGGCHVDGVVHGSVVAERDSDSFLSISEDGRVEGSVKVPRVVLHGTVQGDVHCSELVELGPTARVIGNLHYELIEMAAGAEVNGQLIHEPGKSRHAQIETSKPADATQPMRVASAKSQA